jgi:hypothetical protein
MAKQTGTRVPLRLFVHYHYARAHAEAAALADVMRRPRRVSATTQMVMTLAMNDNELPFGADRLGRRLRRLANRFLLENTRPARHPPGA